PIPATPGPSASAVASARPAASGIPTGWSDHDIAARTVVRRFLGNLAPALKGVYGEAAFGKLATILGAGDNYPELSDNDAVVHDTTEARRAPGGGGAPHASGAPPPAPVLGGAPDGFLAGPPHAAHP